MLDQPATPGQRIFYEELIRSYTSDPRFVDRSWLEDLIADQLANTESRFVLLTGEPGAGKTVLMARLAQRHPDWPCYFIRRDSQAPLSSGEARSFLLAVGYQLAALHPELFHPAQLKIIVKLSISNLQAGGKAIGIKVGDLLASPFSKAIFEVDAHVEELSGELEGFSASRIVTEERLLDLGDLEHLALLEPAQTLFKKSPDARIVILVDALDELRYSPSQNRILDWLAACPELPPNVRFLLTSRLDEDLLDLFKRRQRRWLREQGIYPQWKEQVEDDLRRYAMAFTREVTIQRVLLEQKLDAQHFITQAATKADGNFQYLSALFRGIEQAIESGQSEESGRLLRLLDVPASLEDLYAFFLSLIRQSVAGQAVEVEMDGKATGHLPAWEGLFLPVLGILAVAREPLTDDEIRAFGGIRSDMSWLRNAIRQLAQFLDREDYRYRLYHSSLAEFLTSHRTQAKYPDWFLDPVKWHRRIVACFRGGATTWASVDWEIADTYCLKYLPSHLAGADSPDDALAVFSNIGFLEVKAGRFNVDSLLGDLGLLLSSSLPPGTKKRLSQLSRVLDREAYNLRRYGAEERQRRFTPQIYIRAILMGLAEIAELAEVRLSQRRQPYLKVQWGSIRESPELERTLFRHGEGIYDVAVTVDGRYALSIANNDTSVKLWDLPTGREVMSLNDQFTLSSLAVSSDENIAAVSRWVDNTICVWDLDTGQVLNELKAKKLDRISAVAFVGERDRFILSALSRSGDFFRSQQILQLWDRGQDYKLKEISIDIDASIRKIVVARNGSRILLITYNGHIYEWELNARQKPREIVSRFGKSIAVTSDGLRVVVADRVGRLEEAMAGTDNRITICEVETGTVRELYDWHSGEIKAVAVTPDDRFAISASEDSTLKVWDMESGYVTRTLMGHAGPVNAVAVTPDGQRAVSGGHDGTLKVWNLAVEPDTRIIGGHSDIVSAVVVTPDGKFGISASWDGSIRVWDIHTGQEHRRLKTGHRESALVLLPDGKSIASAAGRGPVVVRDLLTAKTRYAFNAYHPSPRRPGATSHISCLAVTSDRKFAITGAHDFRVKVWRIRDGKEVSALSIHNDLIMDIALSRDSRLLLVASQDGTASLWDLRKGVPVRRVGDHELGARSVAFAPDHPHALVGTGSGAIIVWDLLHGHEIRRLEGHTHGVTRIAVTRDGRLASSVGGDGALYIWDLEAGEQRAVIEVDHQLTSVAFSPDGQSVFLGDEAGNIYYFSYCQSPS